METLTYHIQKDGSIWQEKTVEVNSHIENMNIKNKYSKRVCITLLHNSKGQQWQI